jgi:hypothetical protein
MYKKYLPATSPCIITNDLFLASFLHSVGCTLDRVQRNERRRVSFVFTGERVRELREAYRTGPVKLDMRSFRESLTHVRRMMDLPAPRLRQAGYKQRSVAHVSNEPALQPVPQY